VTIVLNPGGPRSELLISQAYEEEGLECPDVDERVTPTMLLFPRSFVGAVSQMSGEKAHDYCFVGGLYRRETYENRRWILDFARRRFTDRSYLLLTDGEQGHSSLGAFDHTSVERDVFVPKEVPPAERAYFHPRYFELLRSSQFTLCPAGDLPWSMRFFEAIMCRSIPIVSDLQHVGRNQMERAIGYRVLLAGDEHRYDEQIVNHNHRLFLRHQTLIHAT
jgi:Exostosin family